jgi:hypothetical protein
VVSAAGSGSRRVAAMMKAATGEEGSFMAWQGDRTEQENAAAARVQVLQQGAWLGQNSVGAPVVGRDGRNAAG